jgi:hypothetical protein
VRAASKSTSGSVANTINRTIAYKQMVRRFVGCEQTASGLWP